MSVPHKWVAAKRVEQQTTRRIEPGKGESISMVVSTRLIVETPIDIIEAACMILPDKAGFYLSKANL
jgi:hypothetical protein